MGYVPEGQRIKKTPPAPKKSTNRNFKNMQYYNKSLNEWDSFAVEIPTDEEHSDNFDQEDNKVNRRLNF